MARKILEVRNVTKTYPGVVALDDVSFDVEEGEILALIGENGAGKSTVIKTVAGAIQPDSGEIIIDGQRFTKLNPTTAKEAGIGVVYQELNLVPSLSIMENIFLGDRVGGSRLGPNFREMRKRSEEIMEDLGVKIDVSTQVQMLSTAQMQIVEIAKAVVKNCKVLIMDEPSASIPMAEVEYMFRIVRRLKEKGVAVIYISHRLEELFELCDRVTVFRDGQYVITRNVADITKKDLIKYMIGLEHADLAYEWMFRADPECEDSPAGPAETMTPFKEALSKELSARYVEYINAMGLIHPETGAPLTLSSDGRSGGFHDYLMACLDRSAADFLRRLEKGALDVSYAVQDYLAGNYTREAPAPMPKPPKDAPPPPGLGEMLSRPPKGVQFPEFKPLTMTVAGNAKPWLHWDGSAAKIDDLDTYVLNHRRRMKPCTSFDKLSCDSGENQEFGNDLEDFVHFNPVIGEAIAAIADQYPEEATQYQQAYENCLTSDSAPFDGASLLTPSLADRIFLLNPLNFIGTPDAVQSRQARHYRIRVGAADADTSLSVSMTLALRLMNAKTGSVDYALVWDQPHSEADYPGEILQWIDSICG